MKRTFECILSPRPKEEYYFRIGVKKLNDFSGPELNTTTLLMSDIKTSYTLLSGCEISIFCFDRLHYLYRS